MMLLVLFMVMKVMMVMLMKSLYREKCLSLKFLLCLCFFWIIISPSGNAAPSSTRKFSRELTHFSNEVHNYLMEFGYLPKSDIETGNLRTEEQLREAIKSLQKFGNIPVTGVIDEKTKELIRRPRCGVPDKPEAPDFSSDNRRRYKRFVIQGPKWDHTDLTWSLVNQTMSTLNAGQVRRVLTDALNIWARNSKLTFQEVYSEHADIQVLFARRHHGDGYDFDGPGQVLAHAFYPGAGRGGDAHFDEEENWLLTNNHSSDGTNLMGVAVHEFGHSLGLGHSSAEDAIMFPWYHGYEANQELPEDDRIAIQQIYGSKEKQWGPYRPQRPPIVNRPTTTSTTTTTTSTTTTTTTTTTTKRPILRYYPDHRTTYDRDRENNYPRNPSYWDNDPRNQPHHPENNPRHHHHHHNNNDPNNPYYPYDPRYPHPRNPSKDPRTPWNNPTKDSRFDPKNPDYKPRTTNNNDPKSPYYPHSRNPNQNNPRHPNTDPTNNTPRRHPSQYPKDPRTDTSNPSPTQYPHRPHTHTTTHHPRHRDHPQHRPIEKPKKEKPNGCNTDYNAISIIRGELFIFKDKYIWRIGDHGLYSGYPHETTRLWNQLPSNFTHVDAVYENKDRKIVFFIGKQYYVFDSNVLEPGYPRPLTDLGLPSSLEKIDAALIWGYNNRTYLYSDTLYWRLDEDVGKVELDYPRDMSIWQGIGYHIDTGFQYKNGKTYFFKGKGYWEFDDSRMRVAHDRPRSSAQKWMACPRISNEIDEIPRRKEPLISDPAFNSSSNHSTNRNFSYFFYHLCLVLGLVQLLRSFV